VTLLQAFLYFQNYQSDGVFIKITVSSLLGTVARKLQISRSGLKQVAALV